MLCSKGWAKSTRNVKSFWLVGVEGEGQEGPAGSRSQWAGGAEAKLALVRQG